MNVDTFISARAPELQRFVQVLRHSDQRDSTRLARSIPIRPLAVDALRRPCSSSPFRSCPELNTLPCVPPSAKIVAQQEASTTTGAVHQKCIFSLRRELRRLPKDLAQRQLDAMVASRKQRRQQQVSSISKKQAGGGGEVGSAVKKAKAARRQIRRRLFLKRRRGAKRALRRRVAVTKLGFRLGMSDDGQCCCRAYVPSHQFLSRRFLFGEIGAILKIETKETSAKNALQPWTSHHFSQFSPATAPSSSLPLHVTVPRASFTKKSFHRVTRARSSSSSSSAASPLPAVFDLSFVASVQFLGVCENSSQVPALLKQCVAVTTHQPKVVGDGYVLSLLDIVTTPRQQLGSVRRRMSAISIFGRAVMTVDCAETAVEVYLGSGPLGSSNSSSRSSFAVRPCLDSAHHQKFGDDDDDNDGAAKLTVASCGARSPFCLCFEGGGPQLASLIEASLVGAARTVMTGTSGKNAALCGSLYVGVLTNKSGSVFVFGLPFRGSAGKLHEMRSAHSAQYQFFARAFRDAVVQHGAVPGGLEQF